MNPGEVEQVTRYRKEVEKDEMYVNTNQQLGAVSRIKAVYTFRLGILLVPYRFHQILPPSVRRPETIGLLAR